MRFSRLVAIIGFSGFSLLSTASPALAGDNKPESGEHHRDKAKELIRTTIRILEARVAELERTMNFDTREAKELEAHAAIRDRSAAAFTAKAKEYRELLAKMPANDPLRSQLELIATALESSASHDKEFATQRRAAAKVLADQATQAAEFIRLDKISIEKFKGML